MAKFKKTPQNQRGTYKYYDADGKVVSELRPGVGGVTELDIQTLHRFDDREVYENNKSYQGLRTNKEKEEIREWKNEYIENFKSANGGSKPTDDVVKETVKKEFPMMQTLSLDFFDSEDDTNDKNGFEYQAYLEEQSLNADNPEVERLQELLPELTDEQQWLVQKIYFEGVSQTDIAAELGITKQAVRNRLNKIFNRIKKLF